MPKLLTPLQIAGFEQDGYVSPVRVMTQSRAGWYRERLEAFEATYPDDRLKLDQKAHMICPWVDEMIREQTMLDAVEDLIGKNILCWGTSLRAKQPDGKPLPAGIRIPPMPMSGPSSSSSRWHYRRLALKTAASAPFRAPIAASCYRTRRLFAPTAYYRASSTSMRRSTRRPLSILR